MSLMAIEYGDAMAFHLYIWMGQFEFNDGPHITAKFEFNTMMIGFLLFMDLGELLERVGMEVVVQMFVAGEWQLRDELSVAWAYRMANVAWANWERIFGQIFFLDNGVLRRHSVSWIISQVGSITTSFGVFDIGADVII